MTNKKILNYILACSVLVFILFASFNLLTLTENHVFGGFMFFDADGVSIVFPVDEWIFFSGGSCGLTRGVDCHDSTSNNLTILTDGVYRVTYGATGKGSNNHKFITAVFVNGVVVNSTRDIMISSAGEIHKMRGDSDIELFAGDVVDLRIRDITSSGTGTVYEFDINIQKLSLSP